MDENLDIVREMVNLCCNYGVERDSAITGIRAICAYFGGQQIYLPRTKLDGSNIAEQLRGILADALGDRDGDKVLDVLMRFFGGVQLYIPMESRAFRKEIAYEIREKYDGNMETMRDLCREYRMSFTQMYRLWHEAEEDKRQQILPFD